MFQILTNSYKNKKGVKIVNGQWMEIMAGNPREETTLEPTDVQDRVVRQGIDFTIPRAYLPQDYEYIPSIQDWELNYENSDAGDSYDVQT
jgi:hypothetical protein